MTKIDREKEGKREGGREDERESYDDVNTLAYGEREKGRKPLSVPEMRKYGEEGEQPCLSLSLSYSLSHAFSRFLSLSCFLSHSCSVLLLLRTERNAKNTEDIQMMGENSRRGTVEEGGERDREEAGGEREREERGTFSISHY